MFTDFMFRAATTIVMQRERAAWCRYLRHAHVCRVRHARASASSGEPRFDGPVAAVILA